MEPTGTAEGQQDREGHEFYLRQIEFASHVVRDGRGVVGLIVSKS